MLRLYLDDSGTDDEAPVVTMGGYLASVIGWEVFERNVARTFIEAEINTLHAADFHHGKGEFKDWTGVQKGAFVQSFYQHLAAVKAIGFSFSARKKTYYDTRAAMNVNHQVSPYGFCFGSIVNTLARGDIGRDALLEHGCAILIEGGNQHDGDLRRIFTSLSKKYRQFHQIFPSLNFVDKHSCYAIQAADFLAFHDRRQMLGAERTGDHANPPPYSPAMVTAKSLVKHGQIIATEFYKSEHP